MVVEEEEGVVIKRRCRQGFHFGRSFFGSWTRKLEDYAPKEGARSILKRKESKQNETTSYIWIDAKSKNSKTKWPDVRGFTLFTLLLKNEVVEKLFSSQR